MKFSIHSVIDSVAGFTSRHEKFIFTILARILAFGCIGVAACFAVRLASQLAM